MSWIGDYCIYLYQDLRIWAAILSCEMTTIASLGLSPANIACCKLACASLAWAMELICLS
ncbi:hypothetical protein [Nostoc sp. MS1]|uniref:hypothetical protein n=1 Tax=Nostoc sp. MS1 TaxID=2764711 RepID=UPI001CC594B1|nr:hypothetical protein [Nostoc sp. MS1]